ncbi:MAG TPA: DUF1592 domain-containing protein [Polyangiaceae bacterium]|jgi:hypothetical protein|nr:DUF1592 domain-containing protein [Polyangiaceae bacterium]
MRSVFRSSHGLLAALLLAWGGGACTGLIGGNETGNGGEDIPSSGLGPTPLRRLTRAQYDNTIRDLVGVEGDPASGFSPDEQVGAFHSNAVAPVTELHVEQYMDAAEAIALAAVENLDELLPCDPASATTDACADMFIERFGLRAYRRPLDEQEVAELRTVFQTGKATSFADGIRLVIQTTLQSPFFLYHVESDTSSTSSSIAKLNGYEVASRLSYFLWSSMPDDALFDAAAIGELDTPDGLRAQAERMLADPKAGESIGNFHVQWLDLTDLSELQKDTTLFPSFDDSMKEAMAQETMRFADYVIRQGDAKLSTLLTASFSFPSGPLLDLYGVSAPADPNEPVALDPKERSGLLTHAGVLAQHAHGNQTSPVARGVMVRENILCQTLPSPPENVNNTPPDPDPTLTTRERFAVHTQDPSCAACHQLIDGIGFGFENYDAIGTFRAEESGKAVDASGKILGTEDIDGAFNGVVELSKILAQSETVRQCVARQWFRYAFGRVESEEDEAGLAALHDAFARTDFDIRELILALVTSDSFRFRRIGEEGTP